MPLPEITTFYCSPPDHPYSIYVPKTPVFYRLQPVHMHDGHKFHGSPHFATLHPYICAGCMFHHLLPRVELAQATTNTLKCSNS